MPVRRFAPPGLPLDGGSLRILKVDLNQRKRQSDGGDNDDKGHEPQSAGPACSLCCWLLVPCKSGIRRPPLLPSN